MFERYTEQARRAIFFARFEAIHQRADKISTKHLLLGLSWDEDSRAVAVGLLKDKVFELCAAMEIPQRPSTNVPYGTNIEIPLDRNAKIVLAYAAEESNGDRQFSIDTDHLLRGLLRFRNEASIALESIPLDLPTARAASKRHRVEFPPEPVPTSMPIRSGSEQVPGMVTRPFLTIALLAFVEVSLLSLLTLLK
jgi:ATP-dependent Clp protease ATP-binding subunit ClpC